MAYQLTFTCDRCSLQDITDPVGTHALPLRLLLDFPKGWGYSQRDDVLICDACRLDEHADLVRAEYAAECAQADGDAS